jgi:hypothetical protein
LYHLTPKKIQCGEERTVEFIKETLAKQFKLAATGIESHVTDLQRDTGVKDKTAQYWIDILIQKSRELKASIPDKDKRSDHVLKWFESQSGDKINPLLDITGLNPARDTPVELLHTFLLGVEKYVWHNLNETWTDAQRELMAVRLQSSDTSGLNIPPLQAPYLIQYRNNLIGKHFKSLSQLLIFHIHDLVSPEQFVLVRSVSDLGARLWVPEIDNMNDYLVSL